MPVAVEAARTGPIASHYAATATLEVDREAQVPARVSGSVEALEVEEGDAVEEDAILLRIENDEYRLLYEKARSNAENLRSRLERLEKIARELVSVEEYETARNELAAARAEEELARLNLSYTRVRAPFAGRVTRRLADAGQNVSAGTPLFVISDFDPLLARVHVPAREFRKLQTEQPVALVLDSTGQRLQGRIKLVSPVIDPRTGTIKVTVEVPRYPAGTRPGDFVQVEVVTEHHPEAILVPKVAIITDKGDQVVFVVENGTASRRVVEVGFTADEHAEILSGVRPGERVVVKGQRSLEHGAAVKVLEDVVPVASREARGAGY